MTSDLLAARTNLVTLAEAQLAKARGSHAQRSATTLFGGRDRKLRHTLMAFCEGVSLAEHDSPDEATLAVVAGTVTLTMVGGDEWHGGPGDYVIIPDERHSLSATSDAAVILTVVTHHAG